MYYIIQLYARGKLWWSWQRENDGIEWPRSTHLPEASRALDCFSHFLSEFFQNLSKEYLDIRIHLFCHKSKNRFLKIETIGLIISSFIQLNVKLCVILFNQMQGIPQKKNQMQGKYILVVERENDGINDLYRLTWLRHLKLWTFFAFFV